MPLRSRRRAATETESRYSEPAGESSFAADESHGPEFDDPPAGPAPADAPLAAPLDEDAPTGEAIPVEPREVQSPHRGELPGVMIPIRARRSGLETFLMRLIATGGIVGIGAATAAIMTTDHSHGWLIGVVVATVSVILAAILWSSRRL